MSLINWVETVPSDGSAVGNAPTELASHWTAIGTWLGASLYWPGSGGASQASAGELKLGQSLAFYGPQSASSNTIGWYHTGRGFLDSVTSRLYAYDSTGTYLVGTPFLVSHASGTVPGHAWVVQSGSTLVPSTGTPKQVIVPFPSAYSGVAFVMTTLSSQSFVCGTVSSVTTGGFTSIFSYLGPDPQSAFTLYWTSIGTVYERNA